jgi:hypothetical protein
MLINRCKTQKAKKSSIGHWILMTNNAVGIGDHSTEDFL